MMLQKVYSHTSKQWIKCNWFECDKDGYENFKTVLHDHGKHIACSSPLATHINYIFCCESHRDYYMNSPRAHWNLPAGAKRVVR